jgi:hypothetical protein
MLDFGLCGYRDFTVFMVYGYTIFNTVNEKLEMSCGTNIEIELT